jgi:hypothetical protein
VDGVWRLFIHQDHHPALLNCRRRCFPEPDHREIYSELKKARVPEERVAFMTLPYLTSKGLS